MDHKVWMYLVYLAISIGRLPMHPAGQTMPQPFSGQPGATPPPARA